MIDRCALDKRGPLYPEKAEEVKVASKSAFSERFSSHSTIRDFSLAVSPCKSLESQTFSFSWTHGMSYLDDMF